MSIVAKYEYAARRYCEAVGINADEQVAIVEESTLAGVAPKRTNVPRWEIVAAELHDLTLRVAAAALAERIASGVHGGPH